MSARLLSTLFSLTPCSRKLHSTSRLLANSADEWIRPYPVDRTNPHDIAPPAPLPRPNESVKNKQKRLLWSSRKRGILETDLLLSTYFQLHMDTMSLQALNEYDALLNENDWDIYYWTTGARDLPERIEQMQFFPHLVEHCKNRQRQILRMPSVNP